MGLHSGQFCPGTNCPPIHGSGLFAIIRNVNAHNEQVERRTEIGEFLKTRRLAIQPEDVGLSRDSGRRRRAQGLRREEVAALAAISTDYYARIEQGRRGAPWPTLETIASALRLDQAGRDYLLELSMRPPAQPRQRKAQRASPHLLRLLDDLATIPALLLGRRMDVLGWNAMAAALMVTDFDQLPARQRNYVRMVFTDPAVRRLYPDWEQSGRLCVALLHMEVARDPHDPRLTELVGELSIQDVDFRRWWSDHQVAIRNRGVKRFNHPEVGEITLDWETLACVGDPDQQLITWSAEAGTTSHDRLMALRARH
ncbi:helix-turn-helix domain-containing protein [Rhodococcus sp. NPDC057014]|uniref:helix-turn-helix domain-containing protein n=1 Tax=Rhodococcus sp. NPDC057014 TaxID=3346000 RepID=UPI0036374050